MKFYDWKERSPEDWGYLIFTQKGIDKELKKRKTDPNDRPSLELVKEFIQTPKVYQYRIKLKDLAVGETFYSGTNDFFLGWRIE
ncbi:MAG: hypothetical protein LBR46_08565 [Prevotella sp.]|nr:hypothetical protein [Prevotella sp.]